MSSEESPQSREDSLGGGPETQAEAKANELPRRGRPDHERGRPRDRDLADAHEQTRKGPHQELGASYDADRGQAGQCPEGEEPELAGAGDADVLDQVAAAEVAVVDEPGAHPGGPDGSGTA